MCMVPVALPGSDAALVRNVLVYAVRTLVTRTWPEFCRGGSSDHGLSFLFSTDFPWSEFWSEFPHLWGWGWFPHRQVCRLP